MVENLALDIDYVILNQLNMDSPLDKKELARRLSKKGVNITKEELYSRLSNLGDCGYINLIKRGLK